MLPMLKLEFGFNDRCFHNPRKYIGKHCNTENILMSGIQKLRDDLNTCNDTKALTYKQINPDLISPNIYTSPLFDIPEYKRVAYTRFRTSSHHLKVEKGRWNRPITPHIERFCSCNDIVQDELHVLSVCPLTDNIRSRNRNLIFSLPDFFNSDSFKIQADVLYDILKVFEN